MIYKCIQYISISYFNNFDSDNISLVSRGETEISFTYLCEIEKTNILITYYSVVAINWLAAIYN